MLTLVSKDSIKNSDHFDVLCVLIACMVLEIINQMSKNQKSSLIVWNTVHLLSFKIILLSFRRNGTYVIFVRQNGIRQNGIRRNGLTPVLAASSL